ncbi:MAG: HepT-like ribonuclease domain-containing protein [Balneolaceae bacterium]|nr:HepT-like ribonuclease domain-containing protein [Balneolaceae bacterium]
MPHSARKLLLDISISCREIIEFTEKKSLEDLREDRLLQLALEREFEIIGEALSRLEGIEREKLEENIPDYRKIIGLRNVIAHGYDTIDDEAMWDFVENHVPGLMERVQNY